MADILKALPFLTVDEYLWGHSAAFIRLMAYDQSRVRCLTQKQIEKRKTRRENERNRVFTAEDVLGHLGMTNNDNERAVFGDWKAMINARQKEMSEQNKKQ